MQLYKHGLVPALFFSIWLIAFQLCFLLPILTDSNILLLIAHPDDEAMFFAPTLLSFTRPHLNNHLSILCLSSGNASGLGAVRQRELVQSGLMLGVRDEMDIAVLDDERFQDSMSAEWAADDIVDQLQSTPWATSRKELPRAKNILITFDEHGVSGHANHISLYRGAVQYMQSHSTVDADHAPSTTMYALQSTNMLRKYASVLDAPLTMGLDLFHRGQFDTLPDRLLSISSIAGYRAAQKAMTAAHKSQMVWFRWGWISVSRYMIVNNLVRHHVI